MRLCSLWDWNYNPRGMALLESLKKHEPAIPIDVLALDEQTYAFLSARTNSYNMTPYRLGTYENPRLLQARSTRSWTEYCWTLASSWLSEVLEIHKETIAYIDSDCYLFSPLTELLDELKDSTVAIPPHRWTPSKKKQLEANGIYNVGFVYAKRESLACINEWKDLCLDWCFYKHDNGRFGDQAYWDQLVPKYGVHPIEHRGANLAPWNQEQYDYCVDGNLFIDSGERCDPLIFYHFHGFRIKPNWSDYQLHPMIAQWVYPEYQNEVQRWL